MSRFVDRWIRPAFYLGHNIITLAGAVLTTSSAITLLWFWAFEILRGGPIHPYTSIIFYLALPGVFALGLVLMPAGVLWRWWRMRSAGSLPREFPQVDLRSPVLRRGAILVAVATALNVAILGIASFRGVEYMDSAQFCGKTCHSVMAPEYTAYQGSAHSRVACVQCHIGPGAPWFVKAKISGTRQLFAVNLKTYSRPIPSPVRDLRPARDTCEQCHWPQRFSGDKLRVRTKFTDDEKNTPLTTVLALKIGGFSARGASGIHGRHLDDKSRITYLTTDDRRQVIPRVFYRDDTGKTVEYTSSEVKLTPEVIAKGELRTMDCMDCHNRPAHTFEMPERALDKALSEGRISPTLPFIKKKGLEALRAKYPDRATAADGIVATLTEYYKASYPEIYKSHRALVETAVQEVQAIYARNVYPEMKIEWGTYPNNIGHDDFLGCFRCHDDQHKSADGKVIAQECDSCHAVLAQDEQNPKILADLGLK
jgi:nitrate/TMAO reductase-like tetraheme cytochrome c subunit